jgi:microsomal epoxide hydrolase
VFLPLLIHLTERYTPLTLPVHLIVPSLIGYGFSSAPPVDRDFTTADNAVLIDSLMRGLGLEGYIAQGGDIGSYVSRFLGERYDSCKGKIT